MRSTRTDVAFATANQQGWLLPPLRSNVTLWKASRPLVWENRRFSALPIAPRSFASGHTKRVCRMATKHLSPSNGVPSFSLGNKYENQIERWSVPTFPKGMAKPFRGSILPVSKFAITDASNSIEFFKRSPKEGKHRWIGLQQASLAQSSWDDDLGVHPAFQASFSNQSSRRVVKRSFDYGKYWWPKTSSIDYWLG